MIKKNVSLEKKSPPTRIHHHRWAKYIFWPAVTSFILPKREKYHSSVRRLSLDLQTKAEKQDRKGATKKVKRQTTKIEMLCYCHIVFALPLRSRLETFAASSTAAIIMKIVADKIEWCISCWRPFFHAPSRNMHCYVVTSYSDNFNLLPLCWARDKTNHIINCEF